MNTMNIIKFSYLKCFAVIVLIACATIVSAQQKTMTTGQMNINQLLANWAKNRFRDKPNLVLAPPNVARDNPRSMYDYLAASTKKWYV